MSTLLLLNCGHTVVVLIDVDGAVVVVVPRRSPHDVAPLVMILVE